MKWLRTIVKRMWSWTRRPYRNKRDRVTSAGERALDEVHMRSGF